MYIYYCVLAPGGWSESEFSKCHGICGDATKTKLKRCNNPRPSHRWVDGEWRRTGAFCDCNASDSTEVACDGDYATIDEPCNEHFCKYKR